MPCRSSGSIAALALAVMGSAGCFGDDLPTQTPSGSTGSTTGTTTGEPATTSSSGSDTGRDSTGEPSDELPPAPTLQSPRDGATEVPLRTSLCWNPVEDPDGEPLRYRVFVDEIELSPGLGRVGHEGPCVGPLDFVHERDYAWRVQAVEVDDPTRTSPSSETWGFRTVPDGLTTTVFADDFDDDLGWTIEGDARSGAWVRGNPVPTSFGGALSQPTSCGLGESCMFTGQNPAGQADDADVSGGSTVLLSPPFDLSGAAAATVQLRRFFFKSDAAPEPALQVELLVPSGEAGQFEAHLLEQLDATTVDGTDNRWTPVERVACGVPMRSGARLRITARDAGPGILEAAIDEVAVVAHDFTTVCEAGPGGWCDPVAGAAACPGELSCCAQGTIDRGVFRCAPQVPGLDWEAPTPDPGAPNDGPLGCDGPDLIIDPSWIEPVLTDILVSDTTCELGEGCVGAPGWRTILRFSLSTPNVGSSDLVLGVPANEPEVFHFSECHSHYHFDEYARYELRDAGGVVATGHKQAFCLLDTYSWAWNNAPGTYDCSNQGISRGFTDVYESDLPCQWIDVTDVPPGDYTLRATLNSARPEHARPLLVERRYDNNEVEVAVTLP